MNEQQVTKEKVEKAIENLLSAYIAHRWAMTRGTEAQSTCTWGELNQKRAKLIALMLPLAEQVARVAAGDLVPEGVE